MKILHQQYIRRFSVTSLIAAALTVSGGAQTVLNENFESTAVGSLPAGWTSTVAGNANNWSVSSTTPISGSKSVRSQRSGGNAGSTVRLTSASFTTVMGLLYTVTFSLAQASRANLVAGLVGTSGQSVTTSTGSKSFQFTASSTSSQIFFLATQSANGNFQLILDDILVAHKVPELNAAGWPLPMIWAGLIFCLVSERRRPKPRTGLPT